MQTELLNEGKPPQNGIKINYSCLPEAGGEIVPLFCFSGLVASALNQTSQSLSDF